MMIQLYENLHLPKRRENLGGQLEESVILQVFCGVESAQNISWFLTGTVLDVAVSQADMQLQCTTKCNMMQYPQLPCLMLHDVTVCHLISPELSWSMLGAEFG